MWATHVLRPTQQWSWTCIPLGTHAHLHKYIYAWLATPINTDRKHNSTRIDSLILFLLCCWSGGKSASGPQIPGFPTRCWLLAIASTKVHCLTPFAGTQISSYYHTQAGPDQMSPQWSAFRPLGSPVSKPQAHVCLVVGPPDLLSFLLLVWLEVHMWVMCTCTHTHTEDWGFPGKCPSPLAGA